jgi:hypothetical protein
MDCIDLLRNEVEWGHLEGGLSSETKCNTPDLISAGLIKTLGRCCHALLFANAWVSSLATLKELGKDVQIRFA